MKLSFFILVSLGLLMSCERGTVIHDEIIYIDKPHDPCVAASAPLYLPGDMMYGRVTGLKNCLPFMASAELHFFTSSGLQGSYLYLFTYEDWGNFYAPKENIRIGALTTKKETSSFLNSYTGEYLAKYSTLQDYDVAEDLFELDTNYSKNEITFTEIDITSGHAKGYFNCRFLLATPQPSGHNPDTVIFTDCNFDAYKK